MDDMMTKRLLLLSALSVLPLILSACQAGQVAPVAQGQQKLAAGDSAGYLDRISSHPTVSEADAVSGLMLVTGQQKEMTFAEAVAYLKQQKIADAGWNFQADRAITRGKVAYMVYQALQIRGGVTLTLLGPSQRYCLRELQYRGLMSPGLPYNTVTGTEYVSVLARADELRQTGKLSEVMTRQESSEQP